MNPEPNRPEQAPKKPNGRRRGIVIVAVLIVVASLSLAGYHYASMATDEDKASLHAHRNVQARAFAQSGVYYTAGLLSDPNLSARLAGNPWNNPEIFQNQAVPLGADGKLQGYFSIIAPASPDDPMGAMNYGVSDEGGKINVNVIMKNDPTGQTLHDMLVKLPNMTEDIANSIVAWMGGSVGVQGGGAADDYYMQQKNPYRLKNGPIDSIDELLLVKGVTRTLLYGTDDNRNGFLDADNPNEARNNGFDRGWSAYLTVYSREQNALPDGTPKIWLNNPDYQALNEALTPVVGEDMAKFVLLCRRRDKQWGTPNASYVQDEIANLPLPTPSLVGNDYKFKTLFDLVNAYVVPPQTDKIKKVYLSPLKASQPEMLAKFFANTTVDDPTTTPDIPARINLATAPKAVLSTLTAVSSQITDNDVENIVKARQGLAPADLASPAWLLSVGLRNNTLHDPTLNKFITTQTQVYRVQSVGYFGDKGPSIRVEAVIDTNSGRPRILAWRELTELGKGIP